VAPWTTPDRKYLDASRSNPSLLPASQSYELLILVRMMGLGSTVVHLSQLASQPIASAYASTLVNAVTGWSAIAQLTRAKRREKTCKIMSA
jgi:hypothetical protein